MGCLFAKPKNSTSSTADHEMQQRKKQMQSEIKLLLLGAGESGKSTFFKQIKIIHQMGFSPEEREQYKGFIYSNIIFSINALIEGTQTLCLRLAPETEECARRLLEIDPDSLIQNGWKGVFTEQTAREVEQVWKDPAIQQAFERRHAFHVYDGTKHYFDDLRRFADPRYIPTEEDILHCRVKTIGITEHQFQHRGFDFKLVDVGGQRNERRKWIHCFENVTCVLFVVSLSEFDQNLYEDNETNRMQESMKLFADTCNNRFFVNTPIVLLLNKVDIFKDKLKKTDLKGFFYGSYEGGQDYETAAEFIKQQFLSLNQNQDKQIQVYFTSATETKQVKDVFASIQNSLIEHVLNK